MNRISRAAQFVLRHERLTLHGSHLADRMCLGMLLFHETTRPVMSARIILLQFLSSAM